MMTQLLFASCVAFAFDGLSAQTTAWQPSPGHMQIPIWPGVPPDAQQASRAEVVKTTMNDHLVAGRPCDAVDKVSCRPDFAVALYPGHLSLSDNSIALNPDIRTHITGQTPPTFLLQNEDDHVDRVEDALSYYAALKKAGVPVEMHLYAQGGHAFGLRRTKFPATAWPQLVETWLEAIRMISE